MSKILCSDDIHSNDNLYHIHIFSALVLNHDITVLIKFVYPRCSQDHFLCPLMPLRISTSPTHDIPNRPYNTIAYFFQFPYNLNTCIRCITDPFESPHIVCLCFHISLKYVLFTALNNVLRAPK